MGDDKAVASRLPETAEYLYGSVTVEGLAEKLGLLGWKDAIRDDTMRFYRYAASRVEGAEFAAGLLALGHEIQLMAEDMHEFVKTYESKRWED